MIKKIGVLFFIGLFSISLCGCVPLVLAGGAIAGGFGTAGWFRGKLTQEVDAPFEKSIQATKSALQALKLEIVKETKKTKVAQIMSEYTDGKPIWVDIRKVSESSSRIEVRVGVVSNKAAGRRVLDTIKKYL